jgi:sugar lactone lactonase YvrE
MSPYAKSAVTWAAVVAALAAFFTVHYEIVQGAFTPLPDAPRLDCQPIGKGLPGPEDFAIDAAHNVMFVSAGRRMGAFPLFGPRDGLYYLKLDDITAAPVKLAGVPKDFHSHGIDLFTAPDGSQTLMAVSHASNGKHAIDLFGVNFDGGTPKLTAQSTIQGGLLTSPNDLSAVSPIGFYLANDHAKATALEIFLEDTLLWPRSYVLAFNGMGFRIAAQRIGFANGVLATRDGRFLYVTAFNQRKLIAYSRQDFTGDLTEIGSLDIPAKLDNISMDAAGNLIVAGRSQPASSQIFRVHLGKDGIPTGYDVIFSDDGHNFTRASSGAILGNHLFVGSPREDKLLMCDMK